MYHIDEMLLRGGIVVGVPEYYVNLCTHIALCLMAFEAIRGSYD